MKNPAASGETGSDQRLQEDAFTSRSISPCTQLRAPVPGAGGWQQEKALSRRSLHTAPTERPLQPEKSSRRQTHVRRSYNRKPQVLWEGQRESGREQESVGRRVGGRRLLLDIRLSAVTRPRSPRPVSRAGRFGQRPVPPSPVSSLPASLALRVGFASHSAQTSRVLPQPPCPCEGANGPSSSVPFAEPGTNHPSARLFQFLSLRGY